MLWLALLPFLLANLAGWMCSVTTWQSGWRFRLHRLAAGLAGLALTVNAALIAAMITADVLAHQTTRAGIATHQWWLAPLNWPGIHGHPARQVLVGVLVPALFVLALTLVARRSWRYEAIRPPYQGDPPAESRMVTAAALEEGLASEDFWDGEGSVRHLTWLHVAVAVGFLAITLGVTTRALMAGPTHALFLWWIAIVLGGATLALGIGYVCLDALSGRTTEPRADQPGDGFRRLMPYLPVPAAAALLAAGSFAWLQPAKPTVRATGLPGMSGVIGWTALAIAIPVALALVSMLLGVAGSNGTFGGASWITLMLGFCLLNTILLGVMIWLAHLVGPVTNVTATALTAPPHGQIYLSYIVTTGIPLVAWAAVVTVLVFAVTECIRWRLAPAMPSNLSEEYKKQAADFTAAQIPALRPWYWSGFDPYDPAGEDRQAAADGRNWQRTIARAQFLGRAAHDATWLLWAIIVTQLVVAVCVWRFHVDAPPFLRNAGVALSGFALPVLMGFLYAGWSDPSRRRTIGVLWDVGTFWPRSYHPLSPPCYAERAVPELQRRMWWLYANGGRVALVAHSQGAMLATATLVQRRSRPDGDSPALVTFGSPVCKLYGWGFPAYVPAELLRPLAPGRGAGVHGWLNFSYPTDPIGGPVGEKLPADDARKVDQNLLDPADCWYLYGQKPPAATGHSGYWADRRVWDKINRLAAGLRPGPARTQPTARFNLRPRRAIGAATSAANGGSQETGLPVEADRGGEAVPVLAAEGAGSVDGDDGQVGG